MHDARAAKPNKTEMFDIETVAVGKSLLTNWQRSWILTQDVGDFIHVHYTKLGLPRLCMDAEPWRPVGSLRDGALKWMLVHRTCSPM